MGIPDIEALKETARLKKLVQDGHSKLIHLIRWDRVPGLIEARDRHPGMESSDTDVLMAAGFRWERVQRFVDPAIRPIVKRLDEYQAIFVMESCSGHPQDSDTDTGPYLYMASTGDGCRFFLEKLCAEFKEEVQVRIALLGSVGVGGSTFPKQVCTVPRLSYMVTWPQIRHSAQSVRTSLYLRLWSRVSNVLRGLDDRPLSLIDESLLWKKGNLVIPVSWKKELKKK